MKNRIGRITIIFLAILSVFSGELLGEFLPYFFAPSLSVLGVSIGVILLIKLIKREVDSGKGSDDYMLICMIFGMAFGLLAGNFANISLDINIYVGSGLGMIVGMCIGKCIKR